MYRKFLYFFIFFCAVNLFAQNISDIEIVTGKGTKYIPVYNREGNLYYSVKHFADALSLNYFHNSETDKVELKFPDYDLKVTAKNPFIVLNDKVKNEINVFQLPTSTYLINNNVFVPLKYTLPVLQKVFPGKLNFEEPNKLIAGNMGTIDVDNRPVVETPPVEPPAKTNFNVSNLSIDTRANGTLIRVRSNKKITGYSSRYKDGVLKILLKNVNSDVGVLNNIKPKGLVKKIDARNINNDMELDLELGEEYNTHEVIGIEGSNDVLITLHNKIFVRKEDRNKSKEKWSFDVVVIDAGHGGKDAGAIGVTGVKEKNVNLGIALKLGDLIKKNLPGVKIVYTRSTDKFVELYKRGKIANENNGNLFISIHCNSTPKKPSNATGFEVYLLRPGRTKEAIQIAEMENSVIKYEDNPQRYEQLTDENFILVSMAHSSFMKYSENFSDILNKELGGGLNIPSRGVKQAGFYVLVGASMPSVLVEAGFLSNRGDEKYLSGSKGQSEVAKSIFDAIKKYKNHYDKLMELEL